MTDRLRVGVVGAGVIARVMHLNYLRELSDRYEVVALCDISEENAGNNAERYHIPKTFTDWRLMLEDADIDAVFILTSGSHAPIAVAAAKAGKHILVEKPMCFSVAEGMEMKAAADEAGVTLMVAYPKRYDPAYERFRQLAMNVVEPRLLRVTTFESPFLPYIGHYALAPVAPIPDDAIANFTAETQASITRAIGEANPFLREEYHLVLLDTLVHELNTVRGVLGEPTSLEYVDMQSGQLTVILKFGELSVAINWMDLPGITRYGMEFALYGPQQRVTLTFPSPFLRSAPATVEIIEGDEGTTKSRSISEITSYESAFKLELEAFHRCVVSGDAPATSAEDAIHDLALCEAIIRFVEHRQPITDPSAIPALASAN
ncbi:oxidoreductase [Mycobacterium antarcticum]|uniref:Gfo/Idh/MocA family protein n=1 Tax=Mycolicibacterium sp. TUM20983 TaxID=3023369 RepID=UPI002388513B|nr:Gfo/Idh/MocA family oxidoreductase [Mycolicibacterium sp. TUM20983]BDX32876.1 oxidoreductase [Mycolicibacterium sp. TUM20985]GLP76054.1 oxidoreductase [Mycolicibacterium sp. TUM20983]